MIGVFFHRDETGAVTVIVALFITVLFAFVALSVDVARLYEEKRALVSSADLSALGGAQLLWKSKEDAEAQGQMLVTNNPSVNHRGPYSTAGGDLVVARRQAEGTGCGANVSSSGAVTLDPTLSLAGSQRYDCVEAKVVAPAFNFLFGSLLGFTQRSLSASSTAFMGNGAPRGTTIVPWLLRDCPNGAEHPDEAGVATPSGCPYRFSDSFIDDPNSPYITRFSESGIFVGSSLQTEGAGGDTSACPLPNGYKNISLGNSAYMAITEGSTTPCRIAQGLRVNTRGGNLGAQLRTALETTRGASTTACANAAAFNSALGRTGDGDGFVTILQRNPCLLQVAFAVMAAPPSRVPTVETDVAGAPAQMQALVNEPGFPNRSRFSDFSGTGQVLVIRRLAWYYITGYTTGSQSAPIGVYLRAVDTQNSIIQGTMDVCPATQTIYECAQHGVYLVKLVG